MSIFRIKRRSQSTMRRPVETCLNCDSLEERTVMTVSTFSNAFAAQSSLFEPVKTAQVAVSHSLGTPEPTQSSQFASLKAPTGAPKVFQDAAKARSQSGLDGSGLTVAFIDTGIDYTLNSLGAGYGANSKVIAGYDFGMNDSDPKPTWNHGTAVASIVGSTDLANPGIAPGADIVALRVFDDSGNSSFYRIADALEWVVKNHSQYKISVVNISLADPSNSSLNWFAHDGSAGQRITDAIAKLKSLNIPVVSAAGNSFTGTQGMGFTAIVKDTISVTGVDPSSGQLASNAQRLGSAVAGAYATDIAAPSSGFKAITTNGEYVAVDGTSFAAPVVSGSILLMQQKYYEAFGSLPTVDQLDGWLTDSGDATSDPVTGLKIPQINLAKALSLVPSRSQATPVTTVPIASVAIPAVVPVTSVPVSVVPVSTVPITTTPVSTTLVTTTPVTSNPVSTTPVTTTPVTSNPVSTTPQNSVAVVTSPVKLTVVDNSPIQVAATVETAPTPTVTIRVNGNAVSASSQSASLNLNGLQASTKWKTVDIWTGQSIANQSKASNHNVAVTGHTQKVLTVKQNLQERRATRLAKLSAIRKSRLA